MNSSKIRYQTMDTSIFEALERKSKNHGLKIGQW